MKNRHIYAISQPADCGEDTHTLRTSTDGAHLSINQWAEEDRPREKLERLGPSALSNAELLAILIGSGSPKESAVDLMKKVMHDCNNNLNTLGKLSITDLQQYNGVGPAKAITILAACELGKRRALDKIGTRPDLGSSLAIYNYMLPKMQDLATEEAWLLMMNQNFKLIKASGITETATDIRLIIKEAVLNNATIIAFCHNHPSNNPQPSKADDVLTQKIAKACEIMRLFFMDHVIITDGAFYSYHDKGKL